MFSIFQQENALALRLLINFPHDNDLNGPVILDVLGDFFHVVDRIDGHIGELAEQVARFQARFGSWGIVVDVG